MSEKAAATTLFRIDSHILKKIEEKCPRPVVTDNTSAHHAGFLLGIQYVMSILRQDYVV